jgi:hypothetical protein
MEFAMRNQFRRNRFFVVVSIVGMLAVVAWMPGCHGGGTHMSTQPSSSSVPPTTQPIMANLFAPPPAKGGAQLWAENCTRCHNAPPPDRYSDAQWDVIVQHMRMRANLTGQEAKQIAEFLKASN